MNKILFTLVFASLSFTVIQEASAREGNGITKERQNKQAEKKAKEERTRRAISAYLNQLNAEREEAEQRAAAQLLNRRLANPHPAAQRRLDFDAEI